MNTKTTQELLDAMMAGAEARAEFQRRFFTPFSDAQLKQFLEHLHGELFRAALTELRRREEALG